jgi:Histidine kinase-, DNA gyrase B-, and HSP90-like ATPase
VKITPPPSLLQALQSEHKLPWWVLLAELVDNGADAGASRVDIDFSESGSFTVDDNGQGCKDLSDMLSPGKHRRHSGTQSGRHGIGGKEAMLNLGKRVFIRSIHQGTKRVVAVDWERLGKSGDWSVDDPDEALTDEPSGTKIKVSRWNRNKPEDWPRMRVNLGFTFGPAIRCGFQIRLCTSTRTGFVPIEASQEPPLDGVRTKEVDVDTGRYLRMKMGMITDPAYKSQAGITLALEKRRIILARTRLGLRKPTPGLYGYIELCERRERAWKIAKNKDDLSQRDLELIDATIRLHFGDIIAAAEKGGNDIRLAGLNSFLSSVHERVVNERRRKARRRSPQNNTGTVLPSGDGRPHTRAERTQPGDRFPGQSDGPLGRFVNGGPGDRLRLLPEAHAPSDPPFKFEARGTIYVNTAHPVYQACGGDLDKLLMPALVFYSAHAVLAPKSGLLPFPQDEASQTEQLDQCISAFLRAYAEELGRTKDEQASA